MIEYTVKVFEDGYKEWRVNGQLHREGGPAVERANGAKFWYINGKLHREDGPAVEYGLKEWWLNGELHREDGPAVECPDGYKEWWLNDREYTEEEFLKATQPVKELTIVEIEELLGYKVKVIG